MQDLLAKFEKLDIPTNEYAIFGSGPMGVRGLREISDLDVVVKNDFYNILLKKYKETKPDCITIDRIEIYPAWNSKIDNPEIVIDRAETIENFKFIRLEDLMTWKKGMNRQKDLEDIEIIEKYLTKQAEDL